MKDYEARSADMWDEVRFLVSDEGAGLTMFGPLAIYGKPSKELHDIDLGGNVRARSEFMRLGGRSFREVIEPGAFRRSLNAAPDIVLHYQHDESSPVLGRTKAGTLRLTDHSDEVRAEADLPDNEWGRPVRDAVKRGDIGGISFRMGKVTESWSRKKFDDGYDGAVRHIHEIQLRREVSLVTFPGYDTPAAVRDMAEAIDVEPDELEQAFRIVHSNDGSARLTDQQHDLLQRAIATKVDAPYINPTLAQKRADLGEVPKPMPVG